MRVSAIMLCLLMLTSAAGAAVPLESMTKGQQVDGFRVESVYLNDGGQPMGARFIHRKTGFTLDLLQIESVPQAYTWVNSFPVSDQGEPHTQEHLLLGKGTTGRAFAGLDTMWLSQSNAFTQQWRTSYHFNTAAGPDVFFDLFAAQLNALLHPNYTDEEIRREVRNFGITQNSDGTLRLEEKGSVYNEMVSSSGNPYRVIFRAATHLVYGREHPLAFNSGGETSGIRTMKPEDIRNFHKQNYYLANMGTIVAFPKSVPVDEALKRTDAILDKLEPEGDTRKARSMADVPPPQASAAGAIEIAEYPHKNDQQPSPIMFWWPATRNLDARDKLLLDLFLDNIAGDATTNLYKLFIDSKTRTMDIGARSIFSNASDEKGQPLYIGFTDVAASNLTQEKLAEIRGKVMDEIARVASFADGSPELKEFNDRIASRVTETHRDLSKFVNSPPGFGFRNTGSGWMDHLLTLERTPDFKKSVTRKPELAAIRALLATNKNFWKDKLRAWQIAGVTPYAVAAKPSPGLIAREDSERLARSNAEGERLAKVYGVTDAQQAIQRYRTEYDAESAKIDEEAKKIPKAKFVSSPPMTLDDQLQYQQSAVAGLPMVASTFDNMTSATLGLDLRVDTVPAEQLRYLSLMPALLTGVGVIENGKPVSFDEMTERLRNEILSLDASFSTNPRTGRVELTVRGSGNDLAESKRAIHWMRLVLEHPDWRPENLPRIRDRVDQSLSNLRNTMQGSEESWVQNPAAAYRMQTSPLYLAADSFLTRLHNALRLKWMLHDGSAEDREAVARWLDVISDTAQTHTRAVIKEGISLPAPEHMTPGAQKIALDAMKDLDLSLIEIPDSSLARDWEDLCKSMASDLRADRAQVLAQLDQVRKAIVTRGNGRLWIAASGANQKALAEDIASLVNGLDASTPARVSYGTARLVDARLRQRDDTAAEKPVYVGLLAPNMKGGVIITSVPTAHYSDFDNKERQLDYLASRLFAGYGAHGIFLKTIGAGLAYSNGLRGSVSGGRTGYYAERTPELPQTVRFVVHELKTAPRDASLADYAVAQVFGEFRSAATYENRAEAMAADLADGQPAEQVRKFRTSILELRKSPNLGDQLFDRKDKVYGWALPGYNVKGADVADAVYFTIGPDKQLDAFEQYLKEAEGANTRLYKLYPRDFWQ